MSLPLPPPIVTETRLEFFVPGLLVNVSNAREFHLARSSRVQREKDATLAALHTAIGRAWHVTDPTRPKVIAFLGHVRRRFDEGDGLAACFKSHRDALIGPVIHSDSPTSGHRFSYAQVVARPLGVWICVTERKGEP